MTVSSRIRMPQSHSKANVPLADSMLGYYKSSYPKKDGKGKAFYSLTQFEPCE